MSLWPRKELPGQEEGCHQEEDGGTSRRRAGAAGIGRGGSAMGKISGDNFLEENQEAVFLVENREIVVIVVKH